MLQILFYCHHPDLLLTQKRSWARNLYRAPLDFAEQATTGKANKLLVNSLYTRGSHQRHQGLLDLTQHCKNMASVPCALQGSIVQQQQLRSQRLLRHISALHQWGTTMYTSKARAYCLSILLCLRLTQPSLLLQGCFKTPLQDFMHSTLCQMCCTQQCKCHQMMTWRQLAAIGSNTCRLS